MVSGRVEKGIEGLYYIFIFHNKNLRRRVLVIKFFLLFHKLFFLRPHVLECVKRFSYAPLM